MGYTVLCNVLQRCLQIWGRWCSFCVNVHTPEYEGIPKVSWAYARKGTAGFLCFHTPAPKVGPHARACAHTRPRHRRGVGEKPHVRGSVERTASLAVAKTGAAVAKQGRLATWVASARYTIRKGGQRKVQSYFDQSSCGSIRPRLYSFLPCTLLWPYSSKVHLVLATAQKYIYTNKKQKKTGTSWPH